MLVKFDSDAGSMIMFGDVAVALIKLTGHSGTVPGALRADGVAAALGALQRGLATAKMPPPARDKDDDEDKEPPVSLRQRAFPLIELLGRAAAGGHDVIWTWHKASLLD